MADIYQTEEEQAIESRIMNENVAEIYKVLTSTESGKIFCGMQMVEGGLFKNSFINCNTKVNEPEPNAMQLSFLEGRRSMAGNIHDILYTIDSKRELQFECVLAYDKWRKDVAKRIRNTLYNREQLRPNDSDVSYDIINDIEKE